MIEHPASAHDQVSARLRLLPSVDALLRTVAASELIDIVSRERLAEVARAVLDGMRAELRSDDDSAHDGDDSRTRLLDEAMRRIARDVRASEERGLRRVINATGVVLHTNLGRAPLSDSARRRIADEAAGYCTLEYDLASGERGRRAPRVEELLKQITGAEAALVVNNCAAATVLVLAALAADGETIISRGELVEIGGDFRIPDVMRQSGTRMVEVGTTNRTRLSDYEQAITERTRLVARVHPSNFRVVGFTHAPALDELATLCHARGVTLFEDAGSGLLSGMSDIGLTDEPLIPASIRLGADVVAFSGDKLLGGPQAGIIVGRADLIERIRRTPLTRALRADKLVLAALEATLEAHARGTAHTEIPALRMLGETEAASHTRAAAFADRLRAATDEPQLDIEIIRDEAAIGGGSAPLVRLPSAALALRHPAFTADDFARRLRMYRPPIVARVREERVLVNLRAVSESEEDELLAGVVTTSEC